MMTLRKLPAILLTPPLVLLAITLLRIVMAMPPFELSATTPLPPLRADVMLERVTSALLPPGLGCTTMPPPVVGARPLLRKALLFTVRTALGLCGLNRSPAALVLLKFCTITFSTRSAAPELKRIPAWPVMSPLMVRPRKMTLIEPGAGLMASLMLTPVVPAARIDPSVPVQSMVIDLPMKRGPKKSTASTQMISPPAAVCANVNGKVLHGAVRSQGITSVPCPEIHVRAAWA